MTYPSRQNGVLVHMSDVAYHRITLAIVIFW